MANEIVNLLQVRIWGGGGRAGREGGCFITEVLESVFTIVWQPFLKCKSSKLFYAWRVSHKEGVAERRFD